MTAQALEPSVLESKDKTQLLAIAEALGVKATARSKKSEIIDKILTLTGGGPADSSLDTRAESSAPASEETGSGTASGSANGKRPAAGNTAAKAPSTPPMFDLDEEPRAEWELAVESDTDSDADSDTGTDTDSGAGTDRSDQGDQGEGDTSDEAGSGGQGNGAGTPGEGRQRQNGRQRSRNSDGDQSRGQNQSSGNGNGGNSNSDEGDERGSRKRRRRRKKNRGDDGPQGDDREIVEQDGPPTAQATSNEPVTVEGYVDLRDEGYGFVRTNNYLASKTDAYVPVKLTRQFSLRRGDFIVGTMRPAGRNEKNPALLDVTEINGRTPEEAKRRSRFEDLTALFPDQKLRLEDPSDPTNMTARIIDLIAPIGKGQRGIIVSPPKAGKTTVMKTIVNAIERNNPEVKTIVLLIDERPEEVTDFRRNVRGEVIASTFDKPSDQHTQIAEMALEKAKRLVEYGEDVVIVLDGITRLSRAYNLAAPASGRILSGGIDAGALYPPKRFFGAARNVEEGGSLTILATALVETNSRMDEAVFEEFKGTGNMELRLDRRMAERRIYPAIDVDASSTRHEELLFDRKQLQLVWKLRRVLSGLAADGNAAPGLELLVDRLKTFRTNDEFLNEIAKQPGM